MGYMNPDTGYTLVEYDEWGPKYARKRNSRPLLPPGLQKVFIHHSVTPVSTDPCRDMRLCESALHSNGYDPGYNYTVHPSGVVMEGAGDRKGIHTLDHNSDSYAFCLLGNYDVHQPTLAAIIAITRTINLLRISGKLNLTDAAQIRPHRDVYATACPGANVVGRNMDFIRWFTFNPV